MKFLYPVGVVISLAAGILPHLAAQAPVIQAGGIVNAVTYDSTKPVAQGSYAAIFGSRLAAGIAVAASIPLATSITNVSVTFDDVPAPLAFVSDGQINAQVPWEVLRGGTGTSTVVVTNNGVKSAPQTVNVGSVSPGVYATTDGHAIAIDAFFADPLPERYGKIAAPRGSIPGLTTIPAKAGDPLIVYATGLGAVDTPPPTGDNTNGKILNTKDEPVVMIGGMPAKILFSGLAPQYVGVYQLNVEIPKVAAGNAVPIQIQMGGITTPASTNIAIE